MDCRKYQIIKVFVSVLFTVAAISVIASTSFAAPDADVTDIYTPSSLVALQTFVVTVELFNYGTDGTIPLSMYIDGAYQTTFYIPVYEWSYSLVDITVTGGLTAGYHTLMFCASNCWTEGWTWTGTPDLQLTDIYNPTSTTALQDTTLTARIDNTGNADAGLYYIALYIDGALVNAWSVSGLCALCWTEFSVTMTGGLTAGQHAIKFVADYYDNVWEQSELNNERTEYFTWTGTPDLQLTDIYQPSSLTSGTDTTITARIDNVGNADAGPFEVDMYLDGQYFATWTYPSGLQAQYYSESSVTITGGLVDGTHSIEFIADVLGQVAESNESNNNRTESFAWSGGIPDLELTDIYQPSSLTSGTDTTITAKLTNIGYADAGPFELDLYIDGNYVATWTYSSGLQAQYYSEPSVTLTGGLVDGSHDLEFYSDVLYQVSESDETNNDRIETFTWTGGVPDLELTDIYDPTSLVSGEDTTITAKVTNIGYADANPFYLDVYVDGEFVGYFDYTTGLPAWTYSEVSVTFLGGLPSGDHDITFIADALDEVAESDETNNDRTETWTWTAPTCTSDTGTGTGVLGDYKSHIDTCYVSSSDTYNLYDIARRANNNPHGHNGQMADDAAIETHYYNSGLMNDPDNNWNAGNQASGVDAHVYAGWTYDYLRSQLGRNGFDNQGSRMINTVESTDPGYYCPDNASWDGSQVVFCTVTSGHRSMAGALDIVAHEWGHAVTQHASNLNYANESGALNEAFSDWLGVTLGFAYNDPDWQQGENFNVNGDALRDLSNPPLHTSYCNGQWIPQPDHMSGYISCTNDYGGVHLNSGIPNKMFYLLSAFGTHQHYGVNVQGIGIEKAIRIAYWANVDKWTAATTFQNALQGMVDAATDLYPGSVNEVYQVQNAWAAVGVGTLPVIVVNASTGGTVSGGGSTEWGATMTVTATPDTGYIFENWTEGGNVVSTSSSYPFTVDGDRTLVANFTAVPVISVSPVSHDFGSYYIGDTSLPQIFTVTNTGQDILNVSTVSLTGSDVSAFAIYIDSCTGQYLAISGNCIIQVEFSPTSEGVKNANLSISSNDPITPTLNVPLVGTGTNDPPVAVPGGPYSALEGQSITLDGSGSYDNDGNIDYYEWDIDNNGVFDYISTSPTQSHTYVQQGTYTIKLRVADDLGKTDEATTTAIISDTSPSASFTASRTSGIEPVAITFTDTSTAYDGISSISWDFGDGSPAESGSPVSHTFIQDGIYVTTLTVTDNDGSIDTATTNITVTDTIPVADFTGSPTIGTAPLTVDFTDNSAGYDSPLNYAWDFDNNGFTDSSLQNPSYTYSGLGTYSVKLTVTDSDGSTNSLLRTNYISVSTSVYSLTVNKSGAGTGTVTSSPSGINCGADCSETYTAGTAVTLTALPDSGSTFAGWSGGGCSGTDVCVVTINADTNITAIFDSCANLPAKIVGGGYYSTLQEAYDAAQEGDIIQSHAAQFTENLYINRNISVTLEGGYQCDFSSVTGETIINGNLTVSDGTVIIENISLE